MQTILSPAKINIGLWITGKRVDNYHNIYSYIHKISLYDKIYIKPSYFLKIKTSSPNVPEGEENIVFKAVKTFENYTGIEANFDIFIEKNIPVGSGLGGGSSNAAAVLNFLNKHFEYPLTEEELIKIGSYVGSDVPFFFKKGLVKVRGKGDILEETGFSFSEDIFIIYPSVESKTSEIYSKVNLQMLTKEEDLFKIDSLLGEFEKFLEKIENTLGKLAAENYPQIKEVLNSLEYLGFKGYITGTGSAVFIVGKPSEDVLKICRVKGWKLFEAKLIE